MKFGRLEGEQPYLGDLLIMVINHLLIGMILQVVVCVIQYTVTVVIVMICDDDSY